MTNAIHSGTVELPWDAPPRRSNLDASASKFRPVKNVSIVDIINKTLGYDVMLAAGAERFSTADELLAEADMAAQYDTLEPYDES